jgi:hypothetical protein
MQYQVPQFIEVEDKLFGPLTFKQFIYLGGGLGLAYIAFTYVPSFLRIFVALLAVGLGVSLAFVKINNKPFIYMMEAAAKYIIHPRLYVWRKIAKKKEENKAKNNLEDETEAPNLSKNKLKDLAWSLDIHDRNMEQERQSNIEAGRGSKN